MNFKGKVEAEAAAAEGCSTCAPNNHPSHPQTKRSVEKFHKYIFPYTFYL